ncbi:MAG: phosphoglycerate kinase [Ignavibacteriales bacterium]
MVKDGHYSQFNLYGKSVIFRCDFNVPIGKKPESGEYVVMDDERITAVIPGLKELISQGAKVILMSHLGRNKEIKKAEDKKRFSLKPVADMISGYIGAEVKLAEGIADAKKLIAQMNNGDVIMLENLRYNAGEEINSYNYAKSLASLGEVYINNAFGTAHRKHSSTYTIAQFVERAYLGDLMVKEAEKLDTVLYSTDNPKVAILGGKKISDKLGVLKNLMAKMDAVLIGGGMANTFLKALDYQIGNSLYEPKQIKNAKAVLNNGKKLGVEIILPVDVVIAKSNSEDAEIKIVSVDQIPEGWMILDIGPKTVKLFTQRVKKAHIIIWNGPMGVFEIPAFAQGTNGIVKAVAANRKAFSVVGGGESVQAVKDYGKIGNINLCTGGTAALEYLEGKYLPGFEACDG